MKRRIVFLVTALLVLVALVATACGTPTAEPEGPPETVEAGEDTGAVFILGAFRGSEETAFQAVIDAFEAENPDIDIIYSGTGEFETLITVRVEAGDPPDIAAFPQPGAVARLARDGKLVPLWDEAVALYDQYYAPGWKSLGSVDGTPYGMFHRVNAKGWVWYNKPLWNEAGWEVPETYDEFMDLIAQMQAESDIAPMCDAFESGEATGWKGTDWIENFVLRLHPLDVYDAWVAHELSFSSDEIRAAFERLETLWFDPEITYGGPQTIATTNFRDPAAWLFEDPPNCWMHMQGSFVTEFFPSDVKENLDEEVGVFQLPPIREDIPVALEVGGDQYVVFQGKDRPEVRAFIEFLATPASVQPWAEQGGSLFPHQDQNLDWYPTELERNMAEAIIEAEEARFDGSDNMASEVNLAFWQGITDWVSGNRTLDQALADIDESLPE
ncbi:MAG: ABC transporter substrate-binding protein [Anaerolineae bacterium]